MFTLQAELRAYVPDSRYPDDAAAKICIEEALAAVDEGNFGIGCLIVDSQGRTVARGHNHVFFPHFRSDLHGEMVVMNAFEDAHLRLPSMKDYTLYTSLESCPMCMARLITAGVGRIFHIADDPPSGMVHLAHQLPPVWQSLAERQSFEPAQCSPVLKDLATRAFLINIARLDGMLKSR